jgi:lantibiotic modifying enzyme
MLRHIELFGAELPGIGAFEGWGGMLYALSHLATRWHDPAVLSQAGDVVNILASFIEQDDAFGVQRGAAGAIGALLCHRQCLASAAALDAADLLQVADLQQVGVACGDHLLASAVIMEPGLGWPLPGSDSPPLTGFAFGAAGIAWALLALAEASGEARFRLAARQAIAYERSLFSAAAGNWPDLRQSDESNGRPAASPRFAAAWCHGAAGIGLARLSALAALDDGDLGDEIQAALKATTRDGFGRSHCLCHGDMGNLELLLASARALDDPALARAARQMGARIVESIEREGCYCGGPGGVELPGLMLGIAGIGYQMLRLAEPEKVPSILMLDPPVKRPTD